MTIQTLQQYLQARFQAQYRDRERNQGGLVEHFEAQDIPGTKAFSERALKKAIKDYFSERGFKPASMRPFLKYTGPHGEEYGVNLTFIQRGHPLESGMSHRFRVSILDLTEAK